MTQLVSHAPPIDTFELAPERWAGWLKKGVDHDRVVRERFQLFGGFVAVAVIALTLWTI